MKACYEAPIQVEVGWIITDDCKKIYLIFITIWTIERYKVRDISFCNTNVLVKFKPIYIYLDASLEYHTIWFIYLAQKNDTFTYI